MCRRKDLLSDRTGRPAPPTKNGREVSSETEPVVDIESDSAADDEAPAGNEADEAGDESGSRDDE